MQCKGRVYAKSSRSILCRRSDHENLKQNCIEIPAELISAGCFAQCSSATVSHSLIFPSASRNLFNLFQSSCKHFGKSFCKWLVHMSSGWLSGVFLLWASHTWLCTAALVMHPGIINAFPLPTKHFRSVVLAPDSLHLSSRQNWAWYQGTETWNIYIYLSFFFFA